MNLSVRIARIVGPVMIAASITEAMHLDIFSGNTAPVVYLNGTLLFIAGVAIVQSHNLWVRAWPVLVTVTGWLLLAGGLARMAAAQTPQIHGGAVADTIFGALFLTGAVLTFNGYRRPVDVPVA